ncbi:protein kinase [Streptomyces sp. NPDC018964]|uniref:protein kinase domain-containing protein n=1 Tax=Streptomyces sp. NPDC018964 TaxID=3365058 RepID=UPI00378F9F46
MDAISGDQLIGKGRYALRHELGRGGMAAVHLAHDSVLDRQVAIKLLHPELSHDPSFRERFRREAQMVAKLNHPNVVSVFDSGDDMVDGRHFNYMVMEYVEGQSLRDLLRGGQAGRPMELHSTLDLTSEILQALQASHEIGLVHRDVKPANVMVTRRGTVKVMDFGIARALQSPSAAMTQTGAIVGTPQYLSPEQALGKAVDPRSDLYSVGCLLFELLTGVVPFDGDSALAIAYAHVRDTPRSPSSLNPTLPPAVDALVHRAMEKEPAARYSGAAEMLRAVRGTKTSLSFGAPAPATVAQPGVPLLPQNPLAPDSGAYSSSPPPPHGTPVPHGAPGWYSPGSSYQAPARPSRSWSAPLLAATAAAIVVGAAALVFASMERTSDEAKDLEVSATAEPTPPGVSSSPSSAAPDETRTGDPNLTMNISDCQQEVMLDGSVPIPFFKLHHIDSARECAAAGGWKLIEKEKNENLWGEGIVVNQDPYGGFVDDTAREVTVWVSTGHK